MIIKTRECDICQSKLLINEKSTDGKSEHIQVIFTTETTEGRSVKPYLDIVSMDICKKCKETRVGGKSIYASGAQGFNKYYFKE